MIVFWLNDLPLFIHRVVNGGGFDGPRFATVDEGDERTVISTQSGEGAFGPYACITMGPFELDMLGILALVSDALAKAKIPVFVISTYRHDHILVPLESSKPAIKALLGAGLVLKD
ncbi:MAG: ACT domain-containing protein [Methanomassiliicoccales archaeon]|nr:ACT domain-containing protein [Methanomassiliicoccales archaeon]